MPRLVALVPAHNEVSQIAATIESLLRQTCPPDDVVIICDNCTDGTAEIARSYNVEVIETVENNAKKAGALNQAIDRLAASWNREDAVLVMDADSVLEPDFLTTAVRRLAEDDVIAVGGTFFGQDGGGLVGMFQRNEYARYARDVARMQGKVLVLTGTATVFRYEAFQSVMQARREGLVPGREHGSTSVYDTHVLTEDNELTLALLHLGYRIVSPLGCRLTTEVMPTWRALAKQRLRWKRGALENLVDFGWTSVTARYWGRQVMSFLGVVVTLTYLASLLWALVVAHDVQLHAVWLAITAIFILERVVTVRSRGPWQMLLASVLIIEMVFDVFLQLVQARAFLDTLLRRERRW